MRYSRGGGGGNVMVEMGQVVKILDYHLLL